MTVDLNNALSDVLLDEYAAQFPAGSLLQLRTGAPAGAENAAGGTLLAEITLPADPWEAADNGAISFQGDWSDVGLAAAGAGTAIGHYRLRNAAGTRIEEGTVTETGGGGDMSVDNILIAEDQAVAVTVFLRSL